MQGAYGGLIVIIMYAGAGSFPQDRDFSCKLIILISFDRQYKFFACKLRTMMSRTLQQIFAANPITVNASTELMYFSQSPYTAGHDAGMTFANFASQFQPVITGQPLTKIMIPMSH